MLRSLLAIFTGLIVSFILMAVLLLVSTQIWPLPPLPKEILDARLAGTPVDPQLARDYAKAIPRQFIVFTVVCSLLQTFIGSFLAALISKHSPFAHAFVLLCLTFFLGLISSDGSSSVRLDALSIAYYVLILPVTYAGAKLAVRIKRPPRTELA